MLIIMLRHGYSCRMLLKLEFGRRKMLAVTHTNKVTKIDDAILKTLRSLGLKLEIMMNKIK